MGSLSGESLAYLVELNQQGHLLVNGQRIEAGVYAGGDARDDGEYKLGYALSTISWLSAARDPREPPMEVIINDGRLLARNLKTRGLNEQWLKKQLQAQGHLPLLFGRRQRGQRGQGVCGRLGHGAEVTAHGGHRPADEAEPDAELFEAPADTPQLRTGLLRALAPLTHRTTLLVTP